MKKTLSILTMTLIVMSQIASASEIIFITAKGNPIDSVSTSDLKKIYLGKIAYWDNGLLIRPFLQKDTATTNTLIEEYVEMSPYQYSQYWRKAVFTGKGKPPFEVRNEDLMKKMVGTLEGTIGYISADALDSSVKELKVD
ncbi:MAG: hypothetical protein C0621_08480 [Desulfuromonas sp.]|nr:MAG: hypothetical protein C0621_08480 [Desulfuromonas sp.]